MSEFTVCRTLDTHPALRYCLLLDDMRIAGGKPDYRGDNILISWRTKETYGPVDAIKSENKQLATEKAALERRIDELCAEVERGKAEFKKMDVWHSQELKAAMDENAKLRELAVLNWEWAHSCCGNSCKVRTEGCGYGIDRECNYEREIWDRMRELGIEVD